MSFLYAHQRRRFWQDTVRTPEATCYVEYAYGMLIPTIYISGGGRRYPAAVPASLFVGPHAKDQREWIMGLISAALGAAASTTAGEPATDKEFAGKYPTVHAFMTLLVEDGKERSPSSLVVFTEDGQWKICLTEKDANLKLWRAGDTFHKALDSLEKALKSGSADWRKGFDPEKQKRARKGK